MNLKLFGRFFAIIVLFLLINCFFQPLRPIFYSLLLVSVPFGLLWLARSGIAGEVKPNEAVNMLLAAVGVAVVIYWILQGYLAAQLKIQLTGEAYNDGGQRPVIASSVRIGNIGNSNASIESAVLTIVPGNSPAGCDTGKFTEKDLLWTSSAKDKNRFFVWMGADSPYYTIVWGTEESRQVATQCPLAAYYNLDFELRIRQAFTNTVETWRSSAVLPTQPSIGKSPTFEAGDSKAAALVDKVKETIKGREKQ